MRIVIDEKIPYMASVLAQMGHIVDAVPGDKIDNAMLRNAGALFVRTRTKCNATLLNNTYVRFIGTATIGYDHIDADYCYRNGIEWVSAPGCNADAVLQYVQSVIYTWLRESHLESSSLVLGIVGVGHIGSRVARWARSAGMKVLLNDPPREAAGEEGFVSINEIAEKSDIVTFHPTLTLSGQYPSYHLLGRSFLEKFNRKGLLINASRGAVADNSELLTMLKSRSDIAVALDVWEGEPNINPELLNRAYIATPHIAGYSVQGKLNASRMMIESFARFTSYNENIPQICLPSPECTVIESETIANALLSVYSPLNDTMRLKRRPQDFELQRNEYVLRREPSEYEIYIKGERYIP